MKGENVHMEPKRKWNKKWAFIQFIGYIFYVAGFIFIVYGGLISPIIKGIKGGLHCYEVLFYHSVDMIIKPLLSLIIGYGFCNISFKITSIIDDAFNDEFTENKRNKKDE